jgi:hypothetical protein
MTIEKELTSGLTLPNSVNTEKDHIQLRATGPMQRTMESISEKYRREMIAISAYFIAEQRGFTSGYEECDWLTAEAEINEYIK